METDKPRPLNFDFHTESKKEESTFTFRRASTPGSKELEHHLNVKEIESSWGSEENLPIPTSAAFRENTEDKSSIITYRVLGHSFNFWGAIIVALTIVSLIVYGTTYSFSDEGTSAPTIIPTNRPTSTPTRLPTVSFTGSAGTLRA
eukprot:snap_masked-scaffold_7-processed-gene-1.11-mRNA-1 protein AED:1.00 eAED:1.00 QI:0/-1/0/0/-1/1/1/0/145